MSRPDEVIELPSGWREEIRYRKHPPARPGDRSRTRKLIAPEGQTARIWHEVIDAAGRIVHQHEIPVRRKADDAGGG